MFSFLSTFKASKNQNLHKPGNKSFKFLSFDFTLVLGFPAPTRQKKHENTILQSASEKPQDVELLLDPVSFHTPHTTSLPFDNPGHT